MIRPTLALTCGLLASCATTAPSTLAAWSAPSYRAALTRQPRSMPATMVAVPCDRPDLWESERFRQQFLESYLAETEVEPRITEEEYAPMREVLEYLTPDDDGEDQAERAIELLESLRVEGASAVFDYTLANLYFQGEQFGLAEELYEAAIEKHPKYLRAWRNLGFLRVSNEEFESAAQAFTQVLRLGGTDSDSYGLLGYCYDQAGNNVAAETAYRMALLMDPQEGDWQLGLAMSFFKQRRWADAISLTASMIEAEPANTELWILQANAYIGKGEALEAAQNFEMVERLGNSTFETATTLGDIYINEGLYGQAVDSYLRAMELDEYGDPGRVVRAAKVMTANGELLETRRLVQGVVDVHSDWMTDEQQVEILKLQARVASLEGATEEEARVLEQIVSIEPLDGEALILLGQYYERIEDFEKAVFQFERAAGIAGHEADASVRHAQLLVRQAKYDQALTLLRRAQQVQYRESVQNFLEQVEQASKSR